MKTGWLFSVLASAACIAAFPSAGRAETLALSKTFVERVKNLATIPATLEVDVHPAKPHTIKRGGDDGDIHMAGRANEIRLPLVAEIVNARLEPDALALLAKAKTGKTVPVAGVWRIWFEHLGKADQVQGASVDVPSSSNPAHLFELHPLTRFGSTDLASSFVPIQGYQAYDAPKAFGFYEDNEATLQANDTAVLIAAGEGKYNYVELVAELAGPVATTQDGGRMVLANIYGTEDGETPLTEAPRRLVFAPPGGAADPPAARLQGLGQGDRLHVLAIPRVNLAEVSELLKTSHGDEVSVNLPYEMIVVAVLPEL
jgi:hypothetical protein